MLDLYDKLLMRLQAIANEAGRRNGSDLNGHRANGGHNAAIIEFKLYFREGELVGWSKPARTPLEPCPFDVTVFELETTRDWNTVFLDLVRESRRGCNPIEKMLVVRENGEPAGWFADRVKVGA